MNDVMTDGEISFVKKAFNIAMSELAERHPDAFENARLKDTVVSAIMDLVASGQRDPGELARYAVSRCHYAI